MEQLKALAQLKEDKLGILEEIQKLQRQVSLIDALLGTGGLEKSNNSTQPKPSKKGKRRKHKIQRRRARTRFNSPEHNPNRLMATPGLVSREILRALASRRETPITPTELSKIVDWKATGTRAKDLSQITQACLRNLWTKDRVNRHPNLAGKRGDRYVLNDKGMAFLGELAQKFKKQQEATA